MEQNLATDKETVEINDTPFQLECPPGDIFSFPTKGDLVNMINKIGEIPSKLKVYMVQMGDELDAETKEQIESVIKDIEDYMEKFEKILSPYWQKGTVRNWSKETKDAITQLIAEFHLFIPAKVLDLIAKVIPIDFTLNVIGIDINVPKITTKEEQERIIAQISGMGTDVKEMIKKVTEFEGLDEEGIKEKSNAIITAEVDKFWKMIPAQYRQFGGEYGLTVNEWKAKATWSFIKSEIQDWIQNSLFKGFKSLISVFDIIWDALGLPNITALFTLDIPKIIQAAIDTVKLKYDTKNLSIEKAQEMREEIRDKILDLKIGPLPLKKIIGATVEESVTSIEDQIHEFIVAARDFAINWQKKLMFDWVKIVKSFLDAIGLGAIFDFVFLTFCDVLKLIGFPFDVPINLDKLKSMDGFDIKDAVTSAGLVLSFDKSDSLARVVNNIVTTSGQTVIAGSYADGDVVVVNKSNIQVEFTDYSVVDGDIILDSAASEGDEYIVIPTDG